MKRIFRYFITKDAGLYQAGDTIVEVLVSMAILAFAVGGAYVLANKGLRTATEANQRKEATAIAQGQIELIRNAYKTNTVAAFQSNYETANGYCLWNNAGVVAKTAANLSPCINFGTGQFYKVLMYRDVTNSDFVIKVYWDNINGRGPLVTYASPSISATNQSILTAYFRTPN